jgi:uncharacterized protein (DUF362 family)
MSVDRSKSRDRISRRGFLKLGAAAGLGVFLLSCGDEPSPGELASPSPTSVSSSPPATKPPPTAEASTRDAPTASPQPPATPPPTAMPSASPAYLAVAHGADPRAITRAAVAAIGGMARFVQGGDDVIIKPNICVDYRTPEYAATTNPEVVAALVELCLAEGARRVRVMDMPFAGTPQTAYARSGIADAVKAAGGSMEVMNPAKYRETAIPEGRDLKSCSVYQDLLSADVVINVPIAKHHSLARLTLGGKNLLGVVENPGLMHANMGQRVADLISLFRPALTVIDAVRILVANGPSGGDLADVRQMDTVIASHDVVAADAYAATLFGLSGSDISYVRAAADRGLGTLDLSSIDIQEISL